MGFFSKCCSKTNLPVLAAPSWSQDAPRLTHVVIVEQGRPPVKTVYDGYGLNLDDSFDDAKFVLEDAYNGERWDDLPESGYEPNQGFFHDKAFIQAIAAMPAGFATYDDYIAVLDAYYNASDSCTDTAFAKLDEPPPEALHGQIMEYFHYLMNGMQSSAATYAERNPDIMFWLPEESTDRLAQAKVFTVAREQECEKLAANVLANYHEELKARTVD